ncbi:hypothetical protein ABZ951_25645 [Streptomyces sp. NPDC046215]|uniref:Uncharacterized protein n=1 Tax=Streptomyces stramineus TaxID=173861 RepID=A0ABN1BCP0_9ACTN
MGWTVLYVAFGVVALWLLGEVLLQYKARLRWRLLAFVGFLGVVAGVVLSSVVVIAVGAIAFAIGQTYVTLSFRRGFSTGWALRRDRRGAGGEHPPHEDPVDKPRAGRRRKGGRAAEPLPESALESTSVDLPPLAATESDPGLFPDAPHQPAAAPEGDGAAPYGGYGDSGYPAQDPGTAGFTPAPYDTYGGQPAEPPADPSQGGSQGGGYDYGQGQYAAYSDPYIGSRPQTYETYDAYGQPQYETYPQPQQQYGADGYPGEAYAPARYDVDTPPGGVWVPQQRDAEPPPREQLPGSHGAGYDGQYDERRDGQQYRY